MAGGGGGVVSEAHSTLIHKVGNTTPSSAVSSAFYFMGDCTVCLSVCGYSSGRLLLLLIPASRARSPPQSSLRLPKTPPLCPMAPRRARPGPVGGDSAWRQILPPLPPSPHFLFGSFFPSP